MISVGGYSVNEFIADAEKIVKKGEKESLALRYLQPLLQKLVSGIDSVPRKALVPRNDRFAMNLIYMPKDESFSVVGGVWKPGQTTPIHDHLTWALVGIYEGEEREALFKRLDDGSNQRRAKLKIVRERANGKGHVTVLGAAGIHRVDNVSSEAALSIHVYGRDIGNAERHSYDPVTGDIGKFVSGYCNVLRDEDRF